MSKLKYTEYTPEQEDELIEMHNLGLTARAISEKLGMTRNAVIGKINRMKKAGEPLIEKSRIVPVGRPKLGAHKYKISDDESRCQYPTGNPQDDDFNFCGAPIHDNFPYCLKHALICYKKQANLKSKLFDNLEK